MEKPNLENTEKIEKLTITEAVAILRGIMGEIMAGPSYAEYKQVEEFMESLIEGKISPEDAVIKARELEQSRSSHYI